MSLNNSIREHLINVYDKLSHRTTLLNGIALFKYLIRKEFTTREKCSYIIKEVSEQTNKLYGEDKKECLILLPYFFISNSISLGYLPKILNILYNQINFSTEKIQSQMAKIYADIVINVQNLCKISSIPSKEFDNILLNFCFNLINDENNNHNNYKLKNSDANAYIHQIKCGFLFLGMYIDNSINLLSQNKEQLFRIINVLKFNFTFVKSQNFPAKKELLICINKLIKKIQKNFDPYAKDLLNNIFNTFDKLLSIEKNKFNSEQNEIKKNVLEIFYNILTYNKQEILGETFNYSRQILYYAKINKSNLNKDIRLISLKLIKQLSGTSDDNVNDEEDILKSTFTKKYWSRPHNKFKEYDSLNSNKLRNSSMSGGRKKRSERSAIKDLILEDKKKFKNKDPNKKFEFVQKKLQKNYSTNNDNNKIKSNLNDLNSIHYNNTSNNTQANQNNNLSVRQQENIQENSVNFDVINQKITEIKNMNNSIVSSVNNMKSYLNKNFSSMEDQINKLDNRSMNNENREEFRSNNKIDNQIKNIILDDEKLIKFIEGLSEDDIKNICSEMFEQVINRLMILCLINKKNLDIKEKYHKLIQFLLNSNNKKNRNDGSDSGFHGYNISKNLQNNINYLFNNEFK